MTFNPSAMFLLELAWPNLYEPANARELDKFTYRCKGCGTLVKRSDRESHYRRHRREEARKRENAIRSARSQALVKARLARRGGFKQKRTELSRRI